MPHNNYSPQTGGRRLSLGKTCPFKGMPFGKASPGGQHARMGFLAKAFLRGLAATLPLVVTIYILWWFLSGAEELMQNLLRMWIPRPDTTGNQNITFFPGLGIAAGVVVLVGVGLTLNHWLGRWIHDFGISLVERLPLVKTIYRMLKDMVSFFAHRDTNEFNQVVMVRPVPDGPEMLGFVTRKTWDNMPDGFGGEGKIGVYLPMSYQIGGFLIVVDETMVRAIEMEMEEALRIALSAGINSRQNPGATAPN